MNIIIKSNEDLNAYVNEMENKLEALSKTAQETLSKGEAYKKEYDELKVKFENTEKKLEEIKEAQMVRFTSKSADERKQQLGEFMLATARKDYKKVYELGGKVNTAGDDEWRDDNWNIRKAAPDLGTPLRGDAATGNILIPSTLMSEILRIPTDPSALMGKVRTIPMSTRKITFPGTLVGVSFSWPTNEVTAKTEKNPTFKSIDLEAKTAAAWVALTDEFEEDNIIDMSQYLAELFNEAWQLEYDTQLLVAAAAPFTGVMEAVGTAGVTMAPGKTGFSDVNFDDLMSLAGGLTSQTKRSGAYYIMNQTVLDHCKKLKDDKGMYVYAMPGGGQPQTVWGYPVILSDVMPDMTASAKATKFIAFGNPKYLMNGNRVGMEFRMFRETADSLVYDRNFFRVRLRQGFLTAQADGFAILKTANA